MMDGEIRHYNDLYKSEENKEKLLYDTPKIWNEVEVFVSKKIRETTGHLGFIEYCVDFSNQRRRPPKILSLGAGPCPMELNNILPKISKESELVALDINEETLKMAEKRAKKDKIPFEYMVQDVNKLSLQENEFDLIICYASLHHFLELDHITWEINKALKKDGEFVTVDICSRNGYLLWEDNKEVINKIFSLLPERYRYNYYEKRVDSVFPDKDYSINSFECVNSEAIIPALDSNLERKHFIPMTCISRRFFDHMYGFNFDMERAFDKSFVEFILNLDDECIRTGRLKPETFFGAYTKKILTGETAQPAASSTVPEPKKNAGGFFNRAYRKIKSLYF